MLISILSILWKIWHHLELIQSKVIQSKAIQPNAFQSKIIHSKIIQSKIIPVLYKLLVQGNNKDLPLEKSKSFPLIAKLLEGIHQVSNSLLLNQIMEVILLWNSRNHHLECTPVCTPLCTKPNTVSHLVNKSNLLIR